MINRSLNILKFILFFYFLTLSCFLAKETDRRIITIGFSKSMFKDVDTEVAIQIWADELVKNLSLKLEFQTKLYETEKEIITAIKNNEIELVTFPFLEYFNFKNKVNLNPKLLEPLLKRQKKLEIRLKKNRY